MLQVAFIRENKDEVIKRLAKRNLEAKSLVESVVALDEKRRATQVELDNILAESNKLSKDIGALMKNGEKTITESTKDKISDVLGIRKEILFNNEPKGESNEKRREL